MISPKSTAQLLTTISERLDAWHSRFPEPIDAINQLKANFSAKLDRLASDELRLSIGIMGQVNAGKSSFLNALLFDGKPVLPEAATPKTANLTRISYGPTPLFTVTFYSPTEWESIKTAAASTGEHAEAKVGRDLLHMVRQHGLDVDALLAQGCLTVPAEDVTGLMDKLNDYVGENGRYTAVVKATEILLPLEELKGYDVVDTPGMNDPVPSRTQKTREYMAQCDVVFFLTRCSQFLDQSDMDLLARQLPGNGVKHMVLVAGQFDGAVSDDGFDRASLADTERNITTRLGRRAATEIEKLAHGREEHGDANIAQLLRGLKVPIFSSTFAHGFASWEPERWNGAMRHVHKELAEMADSAWSGYRFTTADWERIGNFDALKAAYHAARRDKQALLQAQRDGLLPETERELQIRLQTLMDAVTNRAELLQKGEMADTEAKLKACEASIHVIAARLSEVIGKVQATCNATVLTVKNDLKSEAQRSTQLNARTGTETETTSYQVSTSRWYKPWTWGDKETLYSTSTTSYQYIATSDAIEKLVNYGNESAAALQREFDRVVSLSTLRSDLKRALVDAINTKDEKFDPSAFRATLEGTLGRLELPVLNLELEDQSSAISARFSGEVRRGKEMENLRKVQQAAVESVQTNLLTAFEAAVQTLGKQLEFVRTSLATELASDMQKERIQLQKAFADKDQELKVCAEIMAVCANASKGEPILSKEQGSF